MSQVTDRTSLFLLEAVRKRPQDSARHHAVVHPISPAAGRDGGLPSGGHLFPPAGHLLELHQSNVSRHRTFAFFLFRLFAPHLFRVIIFYHAGHWDCVSLDLREATVEKKFGDRTVSLRIYSIAVH